MTTPGDQEGRVGERAREIAAKFCTSAGCYPCDGDVHEPDSCRLTEAIAAALAAAEREAIEKAAKRLERESALLMAPSATDADARWCSDLVAAKLRIEAAAIRALATPPEDGHGD